MIHERRIKKPYYQELLVDARVLVTDHNHLTAPLPEVGDTVLYHEWDPKTRAITGRTFSRVVVRVDPARDGVTSVWDRPISTGGRDTGR